MSRATPIGLIFLLQPMTQEMVYGQSKRNGRFYFFTEKVVKKIYILNTSILIMINQVGFNKKLNFNKFICHQ